ALIWLWTFFIFPFSYSIWRISDKDALVRACIAGSVIASFSAFAFAILQVAMNYRPEGGAGNAIVFATVTTLVGLVSLASAMRAGLRSRGSILCYAAALCALVAV